MSSRKLVFPDVPAYPCFLLSLLLPGLGQVAAGARTRGVAMMFLAAAVTGLFLGGIVAPPWVVPADGRNAGMLALLVLLWTFAPHDAWFRVRERRNDMLVCLPRTPRVAFLADAIWGGLGRVYLDGGRALPWLLPTAGATIVLGLTAHPAVLVVLGAWNVGVGVSSWSRAVARYHRRPSYLERHAALDAAPFASYRAPSPSLPFASMVAVVIFAMGALFVSRTLQDLGTVRTPSASGQVQGDRFVSADRRVEMTFPAAWELRPGSPPALLEARRPASGLSFSLADVRAPLFRSEDLVPLGALTRFAGRQEAELAAGLPGFRLLSRSPLPGEPPGIRLAFATRVAGDDRITIQDYLLTMDRILVLTLSGAATPAENKLMDEMDDLRSSLRIEDSGR